MFDNVGSIEYDARINTSKLKGDAAQTEAIVQGTGDNVERTGEKSFGAFAGWAKVGLIAAGAATVALGVSVFKTGIEYNTLQQTTRAALKTILGSTEAATKQMNQLNEFVRESPFGKDIFIKAQQQLLGFGVSAEKVIPALDAVQNAVAAVGGSGDQITGIVDILSDIQSTGRVTGQEFQRLGFFGIDAAKLIGDQMGLTSQEIRDMASKPGGLPVGQIWDPLVNGLQTEFGGAADNVKKTWSGTADRIAAAFRDLGSQIAAPFVNPNGGGAAIEWGNKFADFLRALPQTAAPFLNTLKEMYTWFSINILPILKDVVNFMNTQLKQAWTDITTALAPFISEADLIKAILFATLVPLGLVVAALVVFVGVIAIVIAAVARLIGWIVQVSAWFTQLQNNTYGAMAGFINAVVGGINQAISWFQRLPGAILGVFAGAGGWLVGIGRAMIDGLVNGIKSGVGAVADAAKGVADSAVKAAKNALGIKSPSRVFASIGKNVVLGFSQGVDENAPMAASSVDSMLGGAASPSLSSPSNSLDSLDSVNTGKTARGGVTVNLSLSGIMARSKSDERDIAKNLIRTVNEELSAKGVALIGEGNI